MPRLDCLVVGAGPAGLTAALYLARYRRKVLVLDAGGSRARWIPIARNLTGWPDGVSGADLLTRARGQATRYGARFQAGEARDIQRIEGGSGFRILLDDAGVVEAETVILATGVKESPPPFPGFEEGLKRGLVRACPICDGFEADGRRIAVLGSGDHAAAEALFLRSFARSVTLFTGEGPSLSDTDRRALAEADVAALPVPLGEVEVEADAVRVGGERFDHLYSAMGIIPRNALAEQLGASLDGEGRLLVDPHMKTSVPGLYAAGDLVRGLNQINVAMGEAALAATAVHNGLPQRYA